MTNPLKQMLSDDEEVVLGLSLSPWYLLSPTIISIITLPMFGLGIILFLLFFISYKRSTYMVTDKRLLARAGVFSSTYVELDLDKIEGAIVHQGFIGSLADYGNIVVMTPGVEGVSWNYMSSPIKLRKLILEQSEKAKAKAQAKA